MCALNVVDDVKYAKTDEWAKLEDGEIIIGISDYAQDALSDVALIELPELGATVTAGQRFGSVESVKSASDVHSPVSGTVTAVNMEIKNDPETVNKDPFGSGWFIRVKPNNLTELDSLMDATAYAAYCASR